MRKIIALAILATTTLLAACGGGGGDSVSADPQGIWVGTASTGYTVNVVVLDNKEVWGVYASGSTIYGALYGNGFVNGDSFSVSGTDFNFLTNQSTSGSLSGSFVAKSSLSLSNSTTSVSMSYRSSYDTPATASAVTGTWSFIGRSSSYSLIPGSITVDGSGNFNLIQSNCTTTGRIIPRAGGKNIYSVNLASSGVGCAAGQTTLSGIAYLDTSVNPNKFLSLALTPGKNDGLIVIGTKQ
jgi:hypothetical protein